MSKRILITGASTGIGAETAVEMAAGNELFLHYNRSESEARKVSERVEKSGGRAHLIQADLSTESGCITLHNAVNSKTNSLDVLVNNAGGLIRRHTAETLEWELMLQIFALNTFSTMKMTSLCIPLLEKGGQPCIINLTSIAMRTGAPSASIYGASKGAVDSFTRGMAKELAPKIRVNAVAPGVILTPFHDKVTSAEQLANFKQGIPLNTYGESRHIAATIKYLVENAFVTGETIDVNGGHFMR